MESNFGGSLSNVLVERVPYIQKSIAMVDTKALLSPFLVVPIFFTLLKVGISKRGVLNKVYAIDDGGSIAC